MHTASELLDVICSSHLATSDRLIETKKEVTEEVGQLLESNPCASGHYTHLVHDLASFLLENGLVLSDEDSLVEAVTWFINRERRFGCTGEQVKALMAAQ